MATLNDIVDALAEHFPGVVSSEFRSDVRVQVPRTMVFDALRFLHEQCDFNMLVDVTCVDYLHYRGSTDRFGMVYALCNTEANLRLILRVMVNEPDLTLPSVTSLWEGANWLEREVFDMFGICFEGHPDLRRILLPAEFTAYPLRKDYPLQGRGERHNFPLLTREQG